MSSEALRTTALPIWKALIEHPFPRGLADGTLPADRFRFYISQNLLYLPEYARMIAVGASRSIGNRALTKSTRALVNIVDVEIPQNERMRDAIVSVCGPTTASDQIMAPATAAYTSWLLATAASGSALDVQAALLPCAWSYGEIARGLSALPSADGAPPVYREWLTFFASDDYDAVVAALREEFDRDYASADASTRERLTEIFVTGCRMERLFWDQGFAASHWPDLMP